MVSQFSLDATEGARVGIVEFSSDAATLTPLTGSLSEVLTAIDGASAAGGGTSVSDGLELGRVEVNQGARADVPRTILLLTDGVQTVDGNDDTAIAKAAVVKQDGISIVAVGFGGANEQTMRAIASAPSSDFAFFGASMDEKHDVTFADAVGQTYLCSVRAFGPWGVPQAACCSCSATDPLSATRSSMYAPLATNYHCYYDCQLCYRRPGVGGRVGGGAARGAGFAVGGV
ncbi:hypothetical protein EMIHUDRAFT_255363 [Emiliania huxleyi CCMP1516]|uniref:VWFA domain-containing protein n=2 Tax=Emiliania huxleyi TaxID=2903 RepID=A0A0D3JC86_EMIH1|nr:hypothetical protein EMIHUDRAFT_255363 [Emiliania huxleyi CCMP1516]EOD21121.1 hypothetical protein EMIHUDRAFT_255363 [Emiliania huxleyi CCMP1516]|eukprot:XP_005773550.1 hypothetical protein EMIHUDRAFT_255363 [Emiliania huxleyi CCMP1516]